MSKSLFVCQQCGNEFAKWFGKCPVCGEWNSLVETVVASGDKMKGRSRKSSREAKPQRLNSIKLNKNTRTSTQIPELDRVLGGGIVPGQVILIAGEPGIGKSTILLQLADKLGNCLYVSGEESSQQVAIRAQRLGIKSKLIQILEENDIDSIVEVNSDSQGLKAIIVDSIQTMTTSDLSGMAGSPGQVRECAYRLVRLAKSQNIPVFIVGHVTKEGTFAGPALLAHIVDTILWFEGDKSLTLRLLRANKNRFGPTDEVGIFKMEDKGLISVDSLEGLFLEEGRGVPGSAITSILEGTRPILVEIQALVVPTKMAFPRRVAQGIDAKRLEMILAILQKKAGLPLFGFDVFVNVIGGIYIKEPASDFALALALMSSYFDKPVLPKTVAIGEIGLLGEVREVVAQEKRIKEARRLGFKNIISAKNFKYLNQATKRLLK
jgi:DNA repair protein RadA/Sms